MLTTRQDRASRALCEFGSCRLQGRFGLGAEFGPGALREGVPAPLHGLLGRLGNERPVIVTQRQRPAANENAVGGFRSALDGVWMHHATTPMLRRAAAPMMKFGR